MDFSEEELGKPTMTKECWRPATKDQREFFERAINSEMREYNQGQIKPASSIRSFHVWSPEVCCDDE